MTTRRRWLLIPALFAALALIAAACGGDDGESADDPDVEVDEPDQPDEPDEPDEPETDPPDGGEGNADPPEGGDDIEPFDSYKGVTAEPVLSFSNLTVVVTPGNGCGATAQLALVTSPRATAASIDLSQVSVTCTECGSQSSLVSVADGAVAKRFTARGLTLTGTHSTGIVAGDVERVSVVDVSYEHSSVICSVAMVSRS